MTGPFVVSALIVLLVLSLLFKIAWTTVTYRRLTHLRTQAEAAWTQVDVQLGRRRSLLADLLETIRDHAGPANGGAIAAIADARLAAAQVATRHDIAAHNVAAQITAERRLTQALRRLPALAETYPELATDDRLRTTCDELTSAAEKAAYACQYYNRAAQTLNGALLSVPAQVVARLARVTPWPLFESGDVDRQPIPVRF
jgi:LemA protein